MQRRSLLTAALGLPLAGCLALPYGTYFRPEADEAVTLKRAWCSGQAGPATELELELAPGTWLRAGTSELKPKGGEGWGLRMNISVAAGTSLAFTGPTWRLTEVEAGRTIDSGNTMRLRSTVPLTPGERVDPRVRHPSGGVVRTPNADAPFGTATLQLVGPRGVAPQAFTLTSPALQVGEQLVQLPAIELRRAAALSSQRTAYRDPALQAGPASLSFERRSGPATWRGEWDHFDKRYDQRPVHGQIALRLATGEPWRWQDRPFEMIDAADGRRHALSIDSHAIGFADEVALDTPLRAAPEHAGARTTLQLEAALPAGVPSFQLQLPALQIDGRPRAIAPLRFMRRNFDGGIEPFNC